MRVTQSDENRGLLDIETSEILRHKKSERWNGVNYDQKIHHRLNRSLMKPLNTVKMNIRNQSLVRTPKCTPEKYPTSMQLPFFSKRSKSCTWFGKNRPRKFTRLAVLHQRTAKSTILSYSDNFTGDQDISIDQRCHSGKKLKPCCYHRKNFLKGR